MRLIFGLCFSVSTYAACTEWNNFAEALARSMVYRSFPLDVKTVTARAAVPIIMFAVSWLPDSWPAH